MIVIIKIVKIKKDLQKEEKRSLASGTEENFCLALPYPPPVGRFVY